MVQFRGGPTYRPKQLAPKKIKQRNQPSNTVRTPLSILYLYAEKKGVPFHSHHRVSQYYLERKLSLQSCAFMGIVGSV